MCGINKRVIVLSVIFTALVSVVFGQLNFNYAYNYPEFNQSDANSLILEIENHNFFKDNEYFGDYIEGYTLTGFDLKPSLMYYFGSNIRLQAGVYLKKYHGIEKFNQAVPFVTAHAVLADSFQVIIGTLKGNVEHEMLEPIYDTELLYTDPMENGFQLLYSNRWFKGDMWLDWEHFIFRGDTVPEILTFGLNTHFNIMSIGNNSELRIPFQIMIHHEGGQISNFDEPMLTLNNGATGLTYIKKNNTSFIRQLTVNGHFLWYYDMTKVWQNNFNSGWAVYPSVILASDKLQFMGGYFYGNNFAAPKGNYLFQSVSNYKRSYYQKERQLITAKLTFQKSIVKNVIFAVSADGYYDLLVPRYDMAFGMSIFANPQFFLKNINTK